MYLNGQNPAHSTTPNAEGVKQQEPCSLLVGMQNEAVILEDSLVSFYKTK